MSNQMITQPNSADILESVVIGGDLSKLQPVERVNYYRAVCTSLGLNPLTKPFDYLTLNNKLVLYARKDCTEQLRANRKVSIVKLERETTNGVYVVTAYAQLADGRQDSSIGAVSIDNVKGDALANAMMKAETKAKRRVTLSICGLGMLDETEIETIRDARPVTVNVETGEIKQEPSNGKPLMTLAEASAIQNSEGKPYGEIDSDTLRHMANSMAKLAGTDKHRPEHDVKMLAIQTILKARNEQAAQKANGGELPK